VADGNHHFFNLMLLIGSLVITAMLIKSASKRAGVPPLIGYLLMGLGLRTLHEFRSFLLDDHFTVLSFLGKMGLVALLFRIGLESNLKGLLRQLRCASSIWLADITVSGLVGFCTAYFVLGLGAITASIVATAFTATSVGISVAVWKEQNALETNDGQLLVDVAELDDISAVILMGILFTVIPALKGQAALSADLVATVSRTLGVFMLKLFVFGALCYALSRYLEGPLIKFLNNIEHPPDPMLTVTGIGMVIAALAGWLGFSLAIGAFFAGLVFSRDPEAVKMEASFVPIYDLFSPFFFIGIGVHMDLNSLGAALGPGIFLSGIAIVGKMAADGLPVALTRGWEAGALIGISMIPRAEITMVIVQKGKTLGDWAVPPEIYGAMIVVCSVTTILAPLTVRRLLKRYPRNSQT
jgi:Kef-type K+ transport system membrane component KefB